MKGETLLKKSDLKTGMIVRTEHNRFGVVELEKDRIDFCYDPDSSDELKKIETVSLDELIEIDNTLGIGGFVTDELQERLPDLFQEKEIGSPFLWYRIVEIYELNRIYDSGVGVYPNIVIK